MDALVEVVLLTQYATTLPLVMSFSYGWPEDAVTTWGEQGFMDNHFMALGALGVRCAAGSFVCGRCF